MIVNQINTDLLANAKEFKTNEELEYILRRHFQLHKDEHIHEFTNTQFIMGKPPSFWNPHQKFEKETVRCGHKPALNARILFSTCVRFTTA